MCTYRHSSPLEQKPLLRKKLHSGIFLRLYSCRNSHCSPFLQSPRSQCLQTRELRPPSRFVAALSLPSLGSGTWRSEQRVPLGQWPVLKARQMGRSGGRPTCFSRRRKGEKRKL